MDFTPYTLLTDIGWISILLIVGKVLRNRLLILSQQSGSRVYTPPTHRKLAAREGLIGTDSTCRALHR